MKRLFLIGLAALIALTTIIGQPLSANADSLDIKADSAILVDGNTGKVLYAKNADQLLPPASMTKMMTEYLVWDAIDKGEITWETTTQISDYAYSISANSSFSGVGLRQQQDYTVKELYEAMAINSDNATTIALAELISGNESEFVKLMNQTGEELGLADFKFVNSTGLDNKDLDGGHPEGTDENDTNLLSARSSAQLAFHLVNNYPEALEISKIPEIDFDGQTIRNYNYMLPHEAIFLEQFFYEGVDGLKTGFTDLAGYSFTGTAMRNDQRLITVVMKTGSEEERFEETAKLLDHGFSQFEQQEIYPAGYQIDNLKTMPVSKGKEKSVKVSLSEAFSIPIKAEDAEKYSIEYSIDEDKVNGEGELVAPIEAGEVVGTAELVYDGEEDYGYLFNDTEGKVNIVTEDAVEKSNWFMLTIGAIGDFFGNLFTTAVDWVKGLFS